MLIAAYLVGSIPSGLLVARSAGIQDIRQHGSGNIGATLGGMAAMAGHLWPCTLRFRGGRGVATSLGLMLVLDPLVAVMSTSVFIGVGALTRYVSLGSMLAASSAVVLLILRGAPARQGVLCAMGAAAIIWRHRPNIRRLLGGTESRFSWHGRTATVPRAPAA